MITPLLPPDVDVVFRDGRPCLVSRRFDDVYYSTKSGLEEVDHVFITGNDLLARMPAMDRLVVAETGFGTGLNFLGLLRHWQALGDDAPRLHYITTELAPLDAETMEMMLSSFPEISGLIPSLLKILPPRWPGRHRRHLQGGKVVVDFLYGDSREMLTAASFQADAWFLDGFTPWRNPDMWQDELFCEMHRLSAPGATLASFTGAGRVREGLAKAGFEVEKISGEPFKKHRITGRRWPGLNLTQNIYKDFQHTVIIGNGIAGASVAAGLMRQGITPLVLGLGDAPHDGASGNIAAVQSPRLTAEDTFPGRLSLAAYGYARWLARAHGAVLAERAVTAAWNDREVKRQGKITAQGWPEDVCHHGTPQDVSAAVGLASSLDGLIFPQGGSIDPRQLCAGLLDGAEMRFGVEVTGVARHAGGWVLTTTTDEVFARQLVLAAGSGMARLTADWLDPLLPFQVTAGRVSHLPSSAFPGLEAAVSFGGYMARAGDGRLALGASFDRNLPQGVVPPMDAAAHAANKALLPREWQDMAGETDTWQGRVSFRLASPDRQPVAGQIGEGLYVLAALGARGMVTGPLLGEYVAAVMTGAPSPLDRGMAAVVDPFRFSARAGL